MQLTEKSKNLRNAKNYKERNQINSTRKTLNNGRMLYSLNYYTQQDSKRICKKT